MEVNTAAEVEQIVGVYLKMAQLSHF
jgi:hypothetical protein